MVAKLRVIGWLSLNSAVGHAQSHLCGEEGCAVRESKDDGVVSPSLGGSTCVIPR